MQNLPRPAFAFAVVLLGLLTGCDTATTPAPRARVPQLDTEVYQQDDLTQGMEFLHRINDPAPAEVYQLTLYHLNQWLLRANREAPEWKPAGLVQYLPKSLAGIQPMQEIERARLTPSDIAFLHGRIWQREVGRWVLTHPLEEEWSDWIEQLEPRLDESSARQLTAVLQLFDWTIRNIQLDAFPKEEKKAAGTDAVAAASPPQRGVPGPGYQRYPYETMLYGHGDALERARVFMELCRQQEIDSVLLAVDRDNAPLRPWAVAVMIGAELYLFDAELGLPLPGEERRGVVTLAELSASPELLDQLDIDDKQTYWVNAEDLSSLRPLISASPEELSKRMWLLDRSVTGAKHAELFVDADAIAQRVNKSPQLADAKMALWRVPFDCSLYELGRGLQLSRDLKLALEYDRQTIMLRSPGTPVRRARQLYFLGEFETSEETLAKRREQRRTRQGPVAFDGGAVEMLLQIRPEERAIEDLAYSEFWQQVFGLQGQIPKDPERRREMLETVASRIKKIRDDATYWLGIVQYEKRDYLNAIDWLSQSLADDADSPWADGARYNLARCHETLGQHEKAIALYRADRSPQKYGNRLRAKWLEE